MMTGNDSEITDVYVELEDLFNNFPHPFPHSDCEKLFSVAGEQVRHLAPDLDLYCSLIAGSCSRGPRIVKLTRHQIAEVKATSSKSFFEEHLQYQKIYPFITETTFPDLARRLRYIEGMRLLLLKALDLVEGRTK